MHKGLVAKLALFLCSLFKFPVCRSRMCFPYTTIKHLVLRSISTLESDIMPQNSRIWDQTRPNGRIREIYTVSQKLYTVCPVLTPGTAPLTDTFRSGQQLMCYSGLLPAIYLGRHPEWHVSSFGRRPLSVSVAAGSPVPFWRKLRRGGNLFSVIFVLFQYVIFTS